MYPPTWALSTCGEPNRIKTTTHTRFRFYRSSSRTCPIVQHRSRNRNRKSPVTAGRLAVVVTHAWFAHRRAPRVCRWPSMHSWKLLSHIAKSGGYARGRGAAEEEPVHVRSAHGYSDARVQVVRQLADGGSNPRHLRARYTLLQRRTPIGYHAAGGGFSQLSWLCGLGARGCGGSIMRSKKHANP
jgi:hypothetical protein